MSNEKILIIRNAASYDFGGGERFPVFLAQALSRKNIPTVIVSRSKKLRDFSQESNIPTIKGWWLSKQQWSGVNNIFIPLYLIWQIILFIYYFVLVHRLKPTTLHIQSKDDFIAATYAGKLLGKRIIWTDHADLKHVWCNLSVWYKNPIGKMVHRAARYVDAITVVSQSEQAFITERLPTESKVSKKITVVYNGVVDTSSNYPAKKEPVFIFLVASRLVKDKGIQEVIAAFSELHAKYPETELHIIGDGPDAQLFKNQSANIPSIKLLGHQSQPLSFMASADVFVHPTYHEGFSVALVEAGMMSLPIIATSVGGNVEIIKNKVTGLLVPAKDSSSLLSAMEDLLNDTALRKRIAENARKQYLDKFQFNDIVDEQFIPLYRGAS